MSINLSQIPGKWEIYKFLENGEIAMNFHKNREIDDCSNSWKMGKLIVQIPGKWGNSIRYFYRNSVFMEG